MISRAECAARDVADPLAPLHAQFDLASADEEGLIYLDGNSLGALPAATAERIQRLVRDEWGAGLIRSWNAVPRLGSPRSGQVPPLGSPLSGPSGWIAMPHRVGDKIARLIGAGQGEVIVADSTSVNLYKALSAAIAVAHADAPHRRRILSERTNFPTDLYIADTLARAHGLELVLVDTDEIAAHFDDQLAIVLLTHVDYRTGRMHDMVDVTRAAHAAGALVIWDLAHSAGAMPIDLHGRGIVDAAADAAVGCGYKYLNGGPGAPAFVWMHPRHAARIDRDGWHPPLSGWMGHAAPFAFTADYQPAAGVTRFLCGTPPVLSLAALECGVDTVLAAEPHGGLDEIRRKSTALTALFMDLVESRCAGHGLTLVTPRAAAERGSQVSFAHAGDGYAVMQALIARGVIGDFRAPDIVRFGVTPLYTRFVDVWDAVDRLVQVLETEAWREPRFGIRAAVT